MEEKTLWIIFIIFSIISLSALIINDVYFESEDNKIMDENKKVYQGPVPEGFDEEHFRKTGETKPLEE